MSVIIGFPIQDPGFNGGMDSILFTQISKKTSVASSGQCVFLFLAFKQKVKKKTVRQE